ncbi:hypothetical protein NEOC65_001831 [Neochlamydia sp. AcF65]|nr:hypothetical protein [Neochlamydia sp. AcF65]MBS4171467.1 hypothetical protein [Neochlamydia sp. AcF95]
MVLFKMLTTFFTRLPFSLSTLIDKGILAIRKAGLTKGI